jgi:hypothetical protein
MAGAAGGSTGDVSDDDVSEDDGLEDDVSEGSVSVAGSIFAQVCGDRALRCHVARFGRGYRLTEALRISVAGFRTSTAQARIFAAVRVFAARLKPVCLAARVPASYSRAAT